MTGPLEKYFLDLEENNPVSEFILLFPPGAFGPFVVTKNTREKHAQKYPSQGNIGNILLIPVEVGS